MYACSRTPRFLTLALAAATATFAISAVAGFLPTHGLVRTAVVTADLSDLPFLAEVQADPQFGYSVAIDGDWLAVGAPGLTYEDGQEIGMVFLFQREAGQWVQKDARNWPDANGAAPRCGHAVALRLPFLLYGCPGTGGPSPGGDPDSENGGHVLLRLAGDTWLSDPGEGYGAGAGFIDASRCGTSVALSPVHAGLGTAAAAIGCPGWSSQTGRVRTIHYDGNTWLGSTAYVNASDGATGDHFGQSLSLYRSSSGPFILQKLAVGAPLVEHGAAFGSGAAYVFEGSGWIETAEFTHFNPEAFAVTFFGASVAITYDELLIGVPSAYTLSCPNAPRCGTVSEFEDEPGGWNDESTEHPDGGNLAGNPPGAQVGMEFGAAVAYGFDGMIVIGAPGTDGFTSASGLAEDVGLVELRLAGAGGAPLGELRPGPIPTLAADNGRFGTSVDFSDNTLAVGYPGGGFFIEPQGQVWLYQYDLIFADDFD